MSTLRRRILLQAAKLFDLALMVFSFVLATVLVARRAHGTSLADFLSMRVRLENFITFAAFLLASHVIYCLLGVYGSKRFSSRWAEVFDVAKAATLGAALIFIVAVPLKVAMVTPLFILTFWASAVLGGAASRLLLRWFLAGARRRGRNLRHLVVVGTNPRALRFARKLELRPEFGYRLAGFVDDPWHGLAEFRQSGFPLVSDFAGFGAFLREHVADEVMVALPMRSLYPQAARIAALCEEQGIVVRLLSDLFNLHLARPRAGEFEDETVITLSSGAPDGWQHPYSCRHYQYDAKVG